jgi:hypothetical protein
MALGGKSNVGLISRYDDQPHSRRFNNRKQFYTLVATMLRFLSFPYDSDFCILASHTDIPFVPSVAKKP